VKTTITDTRTGDIVGEVFVPERTVEPGQNFYETTMKDADFRIAREWEELSSAEKKQWADAAAVKEGKAT
jgi:hypothetical protein